MEKLTIRSPIGWTNIIFAECAVIDRKESTVLSQIHRPAKIHFYKTDILIISVWEPGAYLEEAGAESPWKKVRLPKTFNNNGIGFP